MKCLPCESRTKIWALLSWETPLVFFFWRHVLLWSVQAGVVYFITYIFFFFCGKDRFSTVRIWIQLPALHWNICACDICCGLMAVPGRGKVTVMNAAHYKAYVWENVLNHQISLEDSKLFGTSSIHMPGQSLWSTWHLLAFRSALWRCIMWLSAAFQKIKTWE